MFKPIGYPVRHRRKVPFQPMIALPLRYREIVKEIRRMDGMLDGFVLGAEDYLELVKDAYADNIHWTTKIEGSQLSLDEVRKLTTRYTRGETAEKNAGPIQEILNHLYSFFAEEAMALPWDVDTIRNTHGVLMKGVNPDVIPDMIRKEEVSVVGPDGTEFFITCPADNIEEELNSLIDWLNSSPYDEITTATLFFHEFESIHPFRDGNGRVGRTLFQILLQELGLKNCKLCKFEKEMLSDSATYYDLLSYADSTGVYTQLVMYIAESLDMAYRDAVAIFGEKDHLANLDENARVIVRYAKEKGNFTFNEATTWIPGLGSQTLRKILNHLVEADLIEKNGNTKGMTYSFKDPLRSLRMNIRDND
ncbi:MAG: Fic family protein [Candidatus Methanomethylophilaceae archaeon]|nr:Fic family protein [Candidatus Methanomethylophilaceae archaeon]